MPSLMRSSSSNASATSRTSSAATTAASAFRSIAAQTAAANAFRARLMSPASSAADTEDDLDLSVASLPPLAPTATSAVHERHDGHQHHACNSCSELETEFAAAVLFVETYNGPHRILTQEHSSPKKDFYAFYQQATVGPCTTPAPPLGVSKTETSKWEKWRNLGSMTRHEAMKRYTTALDNLVDDWRRSATVRPPVLQRSMSSSSSAAGDAANVAPVLANRRSTNMFERLPRIYDDLGELQERVEDESKKRDELEAHLLNFTREYRGMITREMEQVDEMRSHLTSLVRTLEDDVTSYHNELQQVATRQHELFALVENSVLLALEMRAHRVATIVRNWLRNPMLRRVLVALLLVRAWRFVRARQLPQFVARLLIRWLAAVSSLDASTPPSRAVLAP